MNNADIVGIVLIVLGLLCTILSVYTEPVLLLVAGALIAAGIVLIITGGVMCRNKKDVEPTEQPLYACLLYTSPSPRDATLSRMPSSA